MRIIGVEQRLTSAVLLTGVLVLAAGCPAVKEKEQPKQASSETREAEPLKGPPTVEKPAAPSEPAMLASGAMAEAAETPKVDSGKSPFAPERKPELLVVEPSGRYLEKAPALLPVDPPAAPDASKPDAAVKAEPRVLPNPLRTRDTGAGDPPPETPPTATTATTPEPSPIAKTPGKIVVSVQPEPPARKPDDRLRRVRSGKNSGVPFDPIKENGPIFVGWPKPRLALVITGRQDGYIEPCGCAGLEWMKGGMTRRHTLFKNLREQGWPVIGLDVGGIAKGFGREAELKFHIMIDGMRKMGYEGITLGTADLKLPTEEVMAATAPVNNQPSPFVSANVALFDFDPSILAQTRVVEVGGRRLGITGVLDKRLQADIHNETVKMIDPVEAVRKVLPGLSKRADFLILLAHAKKADAIDLARKLPEFDLIVAAGEHEEPPATAEAIPGTKALLVEVGHKGMDAIVLGLYDDPKQPVRYQRVPLDSRFAASPQMKALMAAYQDQLKTLGLAGLGIRPMPQPQRDSLGQFVGSDKCESCHEKSYAIWKKTPHSQAYKSLAEADPPRNFDPECVSCHVIGWHPTKFFPYQGGYLSKEKTPKMTDVGCESCHGPGEKHVVAEMGANEALQEQLRKAVRVTKAEAADPNSHKTNCWSCHDLDNSPEFKFETYWPCVEHIEKEKEQPGK